MTEAQMKRAQQAKAKILWKRKIMPKLNTGWDFEEYVGMAGVHAEEKSTDMEVVRLIGELADLEWTTANAMDNTGPKGWDIVGDDFAITSMEEE